MLWLGHWNYKNHPNARVILLCITVWCLVIPNTKVSNGFTAIHFQPNPFMAVIAWTLSWLGRLVSIMVPLLCPQILYGMPRFYCCSQHLLRLTLDPSPSNAHSYRRWKRSTILKMVIISIKSLISIMCIMLIIAITTFQDGWNLLVPGSYTSSTTRIQFSTSSPLKVSLENCRWFLSVTPEQFSTAYAITFQMRLATAGRVPGTDAGCGLSTRGHWDGPAICNESQWVSRHSATWSATW